MAYSPANPWNFPMYRAPGFYASSYCDVYYTDGNNITDWNDTGAVTIIMAVYMPPGFNPSGTSYDASYPIETNRYNHLLTFGGKNSGLDNNIFIRGYWDSGDASPGLQTHVYVNGGTYYGISSKMSHLGNPVEGTLMQIAFSANPTTGKVQQVVNGNYREVNYGASAWGTLGIHAANTGRFVLNHRANWGSNTFTASGNQEVFYGPLLIIDEALDLTPESADYNRIFDENGDFLWAGEDGSLWLHDTGATKPWYWSPHYAPTTQKGTMTATLTQWNGGEYGHPCGSKNDFLEPSHITLAKTMPSIKLLWDMSRPWGHHYPWISVEHTGGALRQISLSYATERMPPAVKGRFGQVGFDTYLSGNYGWDTYTSSNPMCPVLALSTSLAMTLTMDFRYGANETFGYRKICGWGTSSSSAPFRFIGPWTSESGRWLQCNYLPNGMAMQWKSFGVANNKGQTAITLQWDAGRFSIWVDGVRVVFSDHSATTTQLANYATQAFGFRDTSSSAGGSILHGSDFFMVSGAMTDQQIIDMHNALRGI